jgi:hypothetical protein
MKKLITVLLVATMVSGAFAQATVNGSVRTRGYYENDSGDTTIKTRLRLDTNYTSVDKIVEAAARLQYVTENTSGTSEETVSFEYLYGSVKLAGDYVKLTAGRLYNEDYYIASGIATQYLGNIENDGKAGDGDHLTGSNSNGGFLLQVYPIKGLDLGAYYAPTGADSKAEDYSLNAKYSLDGVGKFVAESNLGETYAKTRYSTSFDFTGVKNLDAIAGYKHLAKTDTDDAQNRLYGIVTYTLDKFVVQVAPEYNLTESALYTEGTVQYNFNDTFTFNIFSAYDKDHVYLTGDYVYGLEAVYSPTKNSYVLLGCKYEEDLGVEIPLSVQVKF